MGNHIGYGRVSPGDQDPDSQRAALAAAGCDEIYVDQVSGKLSLRPELDQVLARLQPGDALVITSLSRAMRSLRHLLELAARLQAGGIDLVVLDQGIDTTTPPGQMAFRVIGAIDEFQRELIVAGTHEGLAAARARGRAGGRPRKLSDDQAALARELYDERGPDGKRARTVAQIAATLGVTRATIYRHLNRAAEPATAVRTQYQARPGRRVIVIADLADLRGPASGLVTLPLRLYWSPPGRVFDLDNPYLLRSMYQTVLGEAARPEDLTGHLDRATLIAVWPDLHLPKGVRQAWQEHHPVLRDASVPTA